MKTSIACVAAVALLSGCKKESPPPAKAEPKVEAARPAEPAPAKQENAVASVSGTSDRECVGAIDQAVPTEVTIGGRKAELNGYRLSFKDKDADDTAVFGVIGNINEDSGENLVNLKKYVEFFKAEKAEAILVSGDTGETQESIERALKPLAETGLPVFVIIGNRECRGDFNDAVANLQKTHSNVVNMNKVRFVDYDDADLLSLPGYHDRRYIHCATGCQYFKQDVDALDAVAKEANDAVVFLAHGPPKGTGANAIDAATEAGNVGDSNLNALLTRANIPFGIFSNIKEAGGRATDLAGSTWIKENQLADALYLNPGPADSISWTMNDGTRSVGMAAVLTVKGKQASYKIFRAKPLEAAEKAEAQKLAPVAKGEEPAKAQEAAAR
ncbi:MAG: metallophosphoesterase [Myxococcales bacterium]